MSLHPRLCRSVRLLLDWSQADLAKRAGISPMTVRNLENGMSVQGRIEARVLAALAGAGVEFHERDGRAVLSFPIEPHQPVPHKSPRGRRPQTVGKRRTVA